MPQVEALKRLGRQGDMPVPATTRKPQPRVVPGYRVDDSPVKWLRRGPRIPMWPERSRDYPETLDQTLARVAEVD